MTTLAPAPTPLERFLAEGPDDDRRELLLGRVFEPMPEFGLHAYTRTLLLEALTRAFAGRTVAELEIQIPDDGRPKPDVSILAEPIAAYRSRGAFRAEDVVLVAEVCVSSHERDYVWKDAQYAKGGIPEYWIVDPEAGTLEVRTEPGPRSYRRREVYGPEDEVRGIALRELLTGE